MKLKIYQIDAFALKQFEGNPAAVIPLAEWLDDELLQAIAAENNLSETAFFVSEKDSYHIRWFTPEKEIKLCGHATLAAAYVLVSLRGHAADTINFDSLSGPLSVTVKGELLILNFPAQPPCSCETPELIINALEKQPSVCLKQEDYLLVYDSPEDIAGLKPNYDYLKKLDLRGVIVTAPGKDHDFVLRFFAPKYGILEDPVTGSAFTQLIPYWADRLGKTKLHARQISRRTGDVGCELRGDRVFISGTAVKFMEGVIDI